MCRPYPHQLQLPHHCPDGNLSHHLLALVYYTSRKEFTDRGASECREGGQPCREKKLFTFLYAQPVFLIHFWKDTIILCKLLEPLMPRRHVSKDVSLKNFHECDCFTCLNQQTLQHSTAISSVTCPGWIENCLLTLDRDSSGTVRSDAILVQTDEVSILLLLTDIRDSKVHHH